MVILNDNFLVCFKKVQHFFGVHSLPRFLVFFFLRLLCFFLKTTQNFCFVLSAMNGNKENHDTVENMDQDHAKTDGEIYKTEEEISESGDTTSSTTESDVTDVDMDSNTEDPFAWDKQVCCHVQVSFR